MVQSQSMQELKTGSLQKEQNQQSLQQMRMAREHEMDLVDQASGVNTQAKSARQR